MKKTLRLLAYAKRCVLQMPHFGIKGLYLALKGFTPNKAKLYNSIDSNYLSCFHRYVIAPNFSERYSHLFNDKLVNYFFLKSITKNIAEVIAYKSHDGELFILNQSAKSTQDLISKPNNGWGGKGVKQHNSIQDKIDNNTIIQKKIKNSNYTKNIYNGSLNTIRILTCIIKGESKTIAAIHRFGSSHSGLVDNFSSGGISAYIDINTGIITSAIIFRKNKKLQINHHPDTNEQITGIQIPNWDYVINQILKIHQEISFVPYIGWDVAITQDSFLIVEANHVSDVDIIQAHGGLLCNQVAKEFYLN